MNLIDFYNRLGYSSFQVKAFVIAPKVTGLLSFIGSFLIVFDIAKDATKRKTQYHRIMFGMSILDMISSFFGPILGTWPMPKGYHYYAIGNLHTCDAAGFFHSLGADGTALYNCTLMTCILLVLKFKWNEAKIQRKAEKWFHIVPWGFGFVIAVKSISFKVLGPIHYMCWYETNQ